jgi:hypothetical protein
MSEITVGKNVDGTYTVDYIDGGWQSARITKAQYYYFKKSNPRQQYLLFQKWYKKLRFE